MISELSSLMAVSPVDGRYASKTSPLQPYFSEYGLIKYRIRVEVLYLKALKQSGLKPLAELPLEVIESLEKWACNLSTDDALKVKAIEKTTNHDVKAVEYIIKEKLESLNASRFVEIVHFGLTSQDINNTAIPLSFQEAENEVLLPRLSELLSKIEAFAEGLKDIPMLARTHGQAATPTVLGKEFQVFVSRIKGQIVQLKAVPHSAKFGGATGNFNAHKAAEPQIDWLAFGNDFVENFLGLTRSEPTTQIEPYDNLAAKLQAYGRINTILMDMARDIWQYISLGYFKQKTKVGEIGSSAMPHKVNPIDFENAEGNLGMANAQFSFMAEKLPISRLQRDLTDSTVLRNLGTPLAMSFLAWGNLLVGLNKLDVNKNRISDDLENNPAVISEAIQTILRYEGIEKPYELLKDLTRGKEEITLNDIREFIAELPVPEAVKTKLLELTPHNYRGVY